MEEKEKEKEKEKEREKNSNSTQNNVEKFQVFEVFKLNSIQKDEVLSLELIDIRKKYIRMLPIENKEQLNDCETIAVMSPLNHMVVDKDQFQQSVRQKIALEVNKHKGEMSEKNIKFIEDLKSQAAKLFNEERSKISQSVKELIISQRQQTHETISKILSNAENRNLNEIKSQIEQILEQEKSILDIILNSEVKPLPVDQIEISSSPSNDNSTQSESEISSKKEDES